MRHAIVTIVVVLITGACTASTETQALSLADQLADTSDEVDRAVDALFDTLGQPYDDRSQLYQRLVDLQLPTTFAIQLDKTQRVDPPPGTDAELDRYLAFIGDLLRASEHLDAAIAAGDPTATAIAAVEAEVASGALAVSLPARSCSGLVPTMVRDLCDPGNLDGYEASLGFELRRFVASFRPAFRVPDTFGDVIRGRVLATLQADAADVLETTGARVADLDPGTSYLRTQQILLDYFPAAADAWGRYQADVNGADPLVYGAITGGLDDERAATQGRLEAEFELVLSADPESHIEDVTGIWFAPPRQPAE